MSTGLRRAAEVSEVVRALHDFEQLPGRFAVAMHEPRILFDRAGVVLLLAAGRKPEGWPAGAPPDNGLRQAARFFVRTVMLRPGADYYTLLGLRPDFDAEALREHYRLMIRMTHPDFMASGESWPADAAARINQANDVLASAVGTQNYQATWEKTRNRAVPQAMAARGLPPRAITGATRRRLPAFRAFALSAAMALLALAALLLTWPASEEGLLTVAVRAPLAVPEVVVPEVSKPAVAARVRPDLAQLPKPPKLPEPPEPPVKASVVSTLPAAKTLPPLERVPALAERKEAVREPPVRVVAIQAVPVQTLPLPVLMPAPVLVALAPAPPDVRLPIEPTPVALLPEPRASGITMDQVQPMLTNVLNSLQSGQAEQVLQWLERPSRQSEAAARFVAAYNQRLAGSRVTGLGPVRFMSRQAGGQLVVDGMVQLWLQDDRQQTTRQDFRLRAYFAPRDSGPVLARLEAD